MSDINNEPPIENAGKIIDRFGGIRPMATKMGVPVTTVQGWKKRDVIPASRREDILKSANYHNIIVLDLVGTGHGTATASASKSTEPAPFAATRPASHASAQRTNAQPQKAVSAKRSGGTFNTIAVALCFVLLALIAAGLVTLAPRFTEVDAQQERIKELEAKLDEVNNRQSNLISVIPADLQAQLQGLQARAQRVQDNVQTLTGEVMGLSSGPLPERIAKLEGLIGNFVETRGNQGLTDFWGRIQAVKGADPAQLSHLSNMISVNLSRIQSQMSGLGTQTADGSTVVPAQTVDEALITMRASDPQMQQAFAGVPDTDLKAAVMLVGFSQLRDSLQRDRESFADDLVLLEQLVAKDDSELAGSLQRLAPQAQQGVLTPSGLSQEFRKTAGDIVVASLKGENVGIEERTKAALYNVLKVEKNGQPLTGTKTQMSVARAQTLLDEGDVDGALAILNELQGPAAQKAQPFVQEAQMTLLASQVQQLLTGNILKNLHAGGVAQPLYTGSGTPLKLPSAAPKAQPVAPVAPAAPAAPEPNVYEGIGEPVETGLPQSLSPQGVIVDVPSVTAPANGQAAQ